MRPCGARLSASTLASGSPARWLRRNGDKTVNEHRGPDGGPITLEALLTARLPKKERMSSTEVDPRPGGQAFAVFVLPLSSASRARARASVAKV